MCVFIWYVAQRYGREAEKVVGLRPGSSIFDSCIKLNLFGAQDGGGLNTGESG